MNMQTYYAVQISDEYRPDFKKISAKNLDDALIEWLAINHSKSFDGINHAKDFIESEYRELNYYDEVDMYIIYDKYMEIGISTNLEAIIHKLSE
jgi:hypothetical protein